MNRDREELNLGGLTDAMKYISQLSKYFDVSKLVAAMPVVMKVFDKNPPLDSAKNVELWLDEVLAAVVALTGATTTSADDEVLKKVAGVLSNAELKSWIATLIFTILSNKSATPEKHPID
jgi:hypothetical protein